MSAEEAAMKTLQEEGCLFKITYERDNYTYYKEDNHE